MVRRRTNVWALSASLPEAVGIISAGSGFLKGLAEGEEAGTTGGGRGAEETAGAGEGGAWATVGRGKAGGGARRANRAAEASLNASLDAVLAAVIGAMALVTAAAMAAARAAASKEAMEEVMAVSPRLPPPSRSTVRRKKLSSRQSLRRCGCCGEQQIASE